MTSFRGSGIGSGFRRFVRLALECSSISFLGSGALGFSNFGFRPVSVLGLPRLRLNMLLRMEASASGLYTYIYIYTYMSRTEGS